MMSQRRTTMTTGARRRRAEMRRHRGFSLLELLICVAIISILMALYLPVLGKARRKAEEVAIKEGLRQDHIAREAAAANTAAALA